MSSLHAYAAQLALWRNYEFFGLHGTSLSLLCTPSSPVVPARSLTSAVRLSIKDEYTKWVAKLAKLAIRKDGIEYVRSIHPPLAF